MRIQQFLEQTILSLYTSKFLFPTIEMFKVIRYISAVIVNEKVTCNEGKL